MLRLGRISLRAACRFRFVDIHALQGRLQVGPGAEGGLHFLFGVHFHGGDGRVDRLGEDDGEFAGGGIEIDSHLAAQGVLGLFQAELGLRNAQVGGGQLLFGVINIERR